MSAQKTVMTLLVDDREFESDRYQFRGTASVAERQARQIAETIAKWAEEEHPRVPPGSPEGGEFTSGGSGTGADDVLAPAVPIHPVYETEPVTREQVEAPLLSAGVTLGTLGDISARTIRALGITESHALTTNDLLVAQGVAEAVMTASEASEVLRIMKDYTREHVTVVLGHFQDSKTGMVTHVNKGKIVIIVNTNTAELPVTIKQVSPRATVPMRHVAAALRRGDMAAALRLIGKEAMWHEMGHVADVLSHRDLTGLTMKIMDDRYPARRSDSVVGRYLWTSVSHYASTSALETTAELFALIQAGHRMPKAFAGFKKEVLA